jgi:hypothetical protein
MRGAVQPALLTLYFLLFTLTFLSRADCFAAARYLVRRLLRHMAAKLIEESAARAMETIRQLAAGFAGNRAEAIP